VRIHEEKQQLTYLINDLYEKQSILELNRELQISFLKRTHQQRLNQLEMYQRLKGSESQIERLLSDFSARRELEENVERERKSSKAVREAFATSSFFRAKGSLPLPVAGRVASKFGKAFDPESKLMVFKKGIEIDAGKNMPIQAISAGKVVYSGEMPNFGRVMILDHGSHFYTLCAKLGELTRKNGDSVAAGDRIALTDDQGTPVYFEIRSRNIAVNPLQWVAQ
jgi:septal ring factor EnvC (AmiA/AmiB activator)